MKIEKIEYIPIRIPKRGAKGGKVWKTALGNNPFGDAVIVLLHTDNGICGLGEVSSIWDTYGSGLLRDMGQKLADSVIGLDVFSGRFDGGVERRTIICASDIKQSARVVQT